MNAPAIPRPSATLCLLRDGVPGLEVMMVRRSATAKFMAKAWVYPGGRVDHVDREMAPQLVKGNNPASQLPWILAALRETVEEVGIWMTRPPRVDPLDDRDVYATLQASGEAFDLEARYFANWITPADLPIRYDARFFAALVTGDLEPRPDMKEIDQAEWVRPQEAILRAARREWAVPFPTHVVLEQLARATSATAFLRDAAGIDVAAVQPRIKIEDDGSLRLLTPGEPGFDDLPEASDDIAAVTEAARRTRGSGPRYAEFD